MQLCVAFGQSQIIVTRIVVLTGVSTVPLVVLVGTLVVLYSLTFLSTRVYHPTFARMSTDPLSTIHQHAHDLQGFM